jgi:hypothetical protein
MITICCPLPTAIASIVTEETCPVNFGQIQKLVFWRHGQSIASVATAEIEATWTTLLAAADDTKAIVTPYTSGASLAPGEARSFGGGNDTLDGIELILGSEPAVFTGRFLQYPTATVALLKQLMCEDLDVIFINENGQFGYRDVSGVFYGFHVRGMFVGDLSLPGYAEPSGNTISFKIPSSEMDDFEISSATDFALTMLNS